MRRALLVSVFLSALGVGLVLLLFGSPESLLRIGDLPVWVLGLALGLLGVTYLSSGGRLCVLARMLGYRLPLYGAMRTYVLGRFAALVTPSGSGYTPAMVFIMIQEGLPAAVASSIALYVMALDLLFFGLTIPLTLVILGLSFDLLSLGGFLWLVLPLAGGFIGAYVMMVYYPALLTKPLFLLFSWGRLRRYRRQAMRFGLQLNSLNGILKGASFGTKSTLGLTTLVANSAGYFLFYAILLSLGATVPLLPTLAASLLATAASFVAPTPGGSGAVEFLLPIFLSEEATLELLTPAVIAWRGMNHYIHFLLGPLLGGLMLSRHLLGSEEAILEPDSS